mmetsp:Transcript_75476/g.209687  ORF Transcript_75476/g.209687 Transcript_75476/m.209687 type:complete len:228 (-) Transcript_75476:19-702(-)
MSCPRSSKLGVSASSSQTQLMGELDRLPPKSASTITSTFWHIARRRRAAEMSFGSAYRKPEPPSRQSAECSAAKAAVGSSWLHPGCGHRTGPWRALSVAEPRESDAQTVSSLFHRLQISEKLAGERPHVGVATPSGSIRDTRRRLLLQRYASCVKSPWRNTSRHLNDAEPRSSHAAGQPKQSATLSCIHGGMDTPRGCNCSPSTQCSTSAGEGPLAIANETPCRGTT